MTYNQYNFEASSSFNISTSLDEILQSFKLFLSSQKISKGSIRSYLSDVRYFLNWLSSFLNKNLVSPAMDHSSNRTIALLKLVNQKLLEAFRDQELASSTPVKTLNRRFSSLRKFGSFLISQGYSNDFDTLRTISVEQSFPESTHHLEEFKAYLWQNNASKLTIKNYLNDTKQFIDWSQKADRQSATKT